MTFILWLLWIGIIGALFYHRVSTIFSTAIVGFALVVHWYLAPASLSLLFITILAITGLAFMHAHAARRRHISKPLLKVLSGLLPSMSETEKVALEAGTVWWDRELFTGAPNWHVLTDFKTNALTKEEREFLDGPVETLCSMTDEWEIATERKDLPPAMWDFLKKEGFFALTIDKKYGGKGFSELAHSEILAKIAGKSPTLVSTVAVPNSLGPAELIHRYGTAEQKEYYLPRLARSEEIPCFGLTSAQAGSDATSMPDYGIVCKGEFEGKQTIGIRLNWSKRYITLAPVATVVGLAFKLFDPEQLIGQQQDIGITCALIPANTAGVSIGQRHYPLASPFQNGPIEGKDVFIPVEWIIGGPKMAGQGWKMLVECLSCGRAITLPSISAGGQRVLASATGAYARIRRQFNQPIGQFEGVQEGLAVIGGNTYLCDSVRRVTSSVIDQGESPSVLGAICKYHLTEKARESVTHAMDIHGGKGIMMGPSNYLSSGYMNAPISITVEGANILTRNMMIFGQGIFRCHPYLMAEFDSIRGYQDNPKESLAKFDKTLLVHLGSLISNIVRLTFFNLTRGYLITAPKSISTKRAYQLITWSSSAFSLIADFCLGIYGGKLKFKERMSARLGDLLSMLYMASCAVKRFEEEGACQEDLPFLQWSIDHTLSIFWDRLQDIIHNLPNRWLRMGLGIFFIPFAKPVYAPNDKICAKVSALLLEPNPARDRLIANAYLSANDRNLIGQLEMTLKQVIAAEPIEKRLRKAEREGFLNGYQFNEKLDQALSSSLITEAEAMLVRQAKLLRDEVIAVDSFDASLDVVENKKISS